MFINKISSTLPSVVLFGKVNAGKSTLFNTLMGQQKAIVSVIPGTTRDSNIGIIEWNRTSFRLADTGGLLNFGRDKIALSVVDEKVRVQALEFLKKSDLVLFLVDGGNQIIEEDKKMALFLKKHFPAKPVILVINKIEKFQERSEAAIFYQLALGEPSLISAVTGSGTGDLLDRILKELKKLQNTEEENLEQDKNNLKVCIIGQPNVGKSSLVNKILGEERVIVSPRPHTTREPQDSSFVYNNQLVTIIDTAGIYKKAHQKIKRGAQIRSQEKIKTDEDLYTSGVSKSFQALGRSEVALLMYDVNNGLTHEDSNMAEEIIRRNKSLIIVANKWDIASERDTKKHIEYIRRAIPFARWAPIQFLSAETGEKLDHLLDLIVASRDARNLKISEKDLDNFLKHLLKLHRPPMRPDKKRRVRILKIIQKNESEPAFCILIRKGDQLPDAYVRFIENSLREQFNFLGAPLAVWIERS